MQLSGKKLTTAILVGLMGATMFGGSVFAEVTDAQFHNEATVRDAADKALQKNITNEATVRDAADKALQKNITNEAAVRDAADKALQKNITNEATVRDAADKTLQKNITNEATVRDAADKTLQKNITNEATVRDAADKALQKNITNEATVRDAADKALQKNITNEAAVRDAADKTLQKNITNEATARTAADTKLQSSVDANAKAISAEVTARTDADKQLNTKVTNGFATIQGQQDEQDAQIAKNKKDIQTNAGNIQNNTDAIKANSDKLDNHEERIASNEKNIETNAESIKKETNNRIDADTALQKNIDKEASDRAAADSQLNTKMNNGFATIQGQQDEQDAKIAKNQKDIQTNAGNIQNNTKAIEANSDKLDNHEERIASNEKNIETNAESIKKETNDRIDAVNGLQTNIDEVSGQVDALQKDSATVKDAATIINDNKDAIENIGNHEKRLKTVENTIGSEAQTRYDADQKLQKNIDAEADARDQADRNLQNQISNNSTSINDLYGRYSSLKTDINKVGARSAALAGLHPLDFDPANKLNFAVASGSFKGENSVALGAFYRPNENIMFSAASTMGDSDNAYTFGLSFKIGPSSAKTKTTSPDAEELYKVVGELQDQLAVQQKEIEQLKADKAK